MTEPNAPRRERLNTTYSPSIGDDICDMIADGLSPEQICDGKEGRPSHMSTLARWLGEEKDFAQAYDRIWLWRVDHMCREIIAIADDSSGDYKIKTDKDGNDVKVLDRENIARSKIRCDHRWKLLACTFPVKYGGATMGGAAPKAPGDDAKLIEAQVIKDEVKSFTQESLREDALAWSGK